MLERNQLSVNCKGQKTNDYHRISSFFEPVRNGQVLSFEQIMLRTRAKTRELQSFI